MKDKAIEFIPGRGFDELVKKLKNEFSELEASLRQRTVESLKNAGKYIHEHILLNKDRADYGKYLMPQLAKKVGKNESTLHRILKFYKMYQILAVPPELTWEHFRSLITVKDNQERKKLEEKIIRNKWNSTKLRQYLSNRRKFEQSTGAQQIIPKLKFTRGVPFVYRVIEVVDDKNKETSLRLDLGFKVTKAFKEDFKKDDFVQVRNRNKKCLLAPANTLADQIFTYKARVLKVTDGDTLTVEMYTGLDEFIEKKLRLRGIDCPEIDTEEGKQAKKFVESRLKDCRFIIIKTYKDKADMWDRYLADVFYLAEDSPCIIAEQGTFLNQELLDKGLARIWQE